jgi:ribosomal protein L24
MTKRRFKVGDSVLVAAGGYKGGTGTVRGFSKDGSRVFVEGIPQVQSHSKRRGGREKKDSVLLPRSVAVSSLRRAV